MLHLSLLVELGPSSDGVEEVEGVVDQQSQKLLHPVTQSHSISIEQNMALSKTYLSRGGQH